ncbi:hypothetical protein I6A62_31385 [Frankia sp. AgW1.1]|nr:hypothetical protein [Frankia sp. AgW1.1]MBL7619499.1 hypothetical protein [Frankia sp. AgB1.8]
MLDRWPADIGLVKTAEAAHGPEPSLVVYCAVQGWLVEAREMAARLRPGDIGSVSYRWEREVGAPIPDDVRMALLDALMVRRERPTGLAEMTEREQDKFMERMRAENEHRAQAVWDLLEPVPHLWVELAQDSKHANIVRSVLLEYPDEIPDDVLIACLPTVTLDHLLATLDDAPSWLDGKVRMTVAAGHVRRRPRLRVIATDRLRQIAQDAVDGGWTPRRRSLGPDWSGIANLAALTDDPALLSAAAAAAAEPERREAPYLRYYPNVPDSQAERTDAILALVANRATPGADLVAVLPTLDGQTLSRVLEQAGEDLAAACHTQLDRLAREAAARQPKYVAVPSDEELARSADPVAVLRDHLRYLRYPAAQRDLTAEGLLRSRYTTRELLELIPARHVLSYADRADQIAEMIIEVCGDQIGRWQALAGAAEAKPALSMTFKAWLARLGD